jgi:predicted FMN-binding regulatory protein PaiB
VIFYPFYEASAPETRALLETQRGGRLVTVSPEGWPVVGVYPFVALADYVEIHLPAGDEQLAHLAACARCTFEIGDVLAFVPSHWEDPQSAMGADLYHRTLVIEAEAALVKEPAAVIEHLQRLLRRYQPEGQYRPPTVGDGHYAGAVSRLTLVRLVPRRIRSKFKLGQNRPVEMRRHIEEQLRRRGAAGDAAAAEAVRASREAKG